MKQGSLISEVRQFIDRGEIQQAWDTLDRAGNAPSKRDGSLRELRLECCVAQNRWEEGASLAGALLHDGVKSRTVARFHCAYARHRLEVGDRSRALWEVAIALGTDDQSRRFILEDAQLCSLISG